MCPAPWTSPDSSGVCAMIAAQAARAPGAAAIVCGGDVVSFGELMAWSRRLAARLRATGAGPESRVGVYMKRRPEIVASALAILEAGAAYVPLDPAYPRERLRTMGEQARPPVLLTQPHLAGALPFDPEVVLFPEQDRGAAAGDEAPPGGDGAAGGAEDDRAACVIFTSGSTGRPKGIVLTQRGLCHQLRAVQRVFRLGPGDRLLQFASPSFDVGVWEIFLALSSGATLCLTGGSKPPTENLHRLLQEQGITFAILPPTVLRLISPEDLPALRTVVSVGECCSAEIVRSWLPGRRFINGYGPAEITVLASAWLADPAESGASPIGLPLEGYRIHLLDGNDAVQPGATAEICVGGPGVCRGYLDHPALTAERFVPDPFASAPGARLYRTGDLGRWRPDGLLEFAGRIDHQVKIRGVRVELGEIEAALREHPSVRDAVVLVREDPPGDLRLFAYLLADGASPSVAELRRFLRRSLPEAMVPAAFVFLSAFPMSPNRKVDRAALLASERPAALPAAVRPRDGRDGLERELAAIWEEVLGQPVDPAADFSDLGGHSITAVRLCARIQERLHVSLPAATLLEAPTVELLAARLREGERPASALVAFRPHGTRPPLFFVHGADGSVFYYRRLVEHLGPDQPFYGLQGTAARRLVASNEELAARYLVDVRAVQPRGPYFLGGYCMGGTVAFEMARQLRSAGEEVALLAAVDTYDWSRIASGPLLERLAFLTQKLKFHGRNVLRLSGGGRRLFLREKALWGAALVAARRQRARDGDGSDFQDLLTRYVPGFYPGCLTHFRSLAAFDRYRASELVPGVHAAEVEVEEVPVYPGGILVEPFVRLLAERLLGRMDAASAARSYRRLPPLTREALSI
jgi:amino acid adenylation domain-containing protein